MKWSVQHEHAHSKQPKTQGPYFLALIRNTLPPLEPCTLCHGAKSLVCYDATYRRGFNSLRIPSIAIMSFASSVPPHDLVQVLRGFYIEMCVYIYTSIYMYTYIHTYIHTYVHTYIHVYLHLCTYIYTHTCMYIYIYLSLYIYIYIYVYI